MVVRGAVVVAMLASLVAGPAGYAAPSGGTPDLALAVAAAGPAVPGQPLTWTATVTNNGASAAESVTLTQTVPVGPGEGVVSAIATVGPCVVRPPGTVACDLGTLDAGAVARVTVGQTLAAARTQAPSTSVIATAVTMDSGTPDNTASASAVLHPAADLWLSGGVSVPDNLLGGSPTVSLVVTDNGPSAVPAGVRARVTLPDQVDFDGGSPGCTAAGRVVTCVLAKPLGVGPGNAVTLTVRGTPVNGASQGYPATVDLPAGVTDPNPGSNRVALTNPGPEDADVAVSTAGPADPVPAGATASVTYTVTNHGPSDATGVTVSAALPAGVHLDSSANGCTANGQALTCPSIPALATGASVALVVTLAVDPGQPAGTVLTPVRVAVAGPRDPNDGNRVGYAPLAVVRRANLTLNASRGDGPLNAGQPVRYVLTVHNFGPGTATGVTVTDRLPMEVGSGGGAVPGGTCTVAGALHTCTLDAPLPVDASVAVSVTGSVDRSVAGETITDTGFASAADPDLDITDNGASSTGVVEGALTPSARRVSSESPVGRIAAHLTWWIWAGVGIVLLGVALFAVALRRGGLARRGEVDRW